MLKRLAKPESQNFLGIRLSRDSATVLCLGPQPRSPNILGCFSVSVEDEQEQNPQTLARLIAQGCTQRKLDFFEAAVALDCALFMQHNLHSEFSDQRQIATTIRFDAEETLATDISDVAIAFQINSTDQHGSDLTVYTAQRKILAEVIHALQANGIDPVTIEPDVNCLSRFIDHRLLSDESERNSTMFGLLARRNGYFVVPARSGGDSQKALMLRTFLIGSKQNRASLITREGLMTCALAEAGEPISRFMVFDSTGTVDQEQLGEKLGVEVDTLNLTDSVPAEMPDDFVDPVDFAIAWGAGLTHTQPAQRIDFRSDFMPYQGRKRRLEKTLKFASISVTVLLLAVGMHFQAKFWRASKDRSNLNNRFAAEFSSVMRGQKLPERTSPTSNLRSELNQIKANKTGFFTGDGEKSIAQKLSLVLDAVNKCAAETDLNVKLISITSRNITIAGDTRAQGNRNTLKFFSAIKASGLNILSQRLSSKGGRDSFSITVAPKT